MNERKGHREVVEGGFGLRKGTKTLRNFETSRSGLCRKTNRDNKGLRESKGGSSGGECGCLPAIYVNARKGRFKEKKRGFKGRGGDG